VTTEKYKLEELLADPLAPASAAPRAVGYVGADVPADVLAAPVIFATHLPWNHEQKTPFADRWLEDSFPGWSRSMLQDWADGRFDFMTHVVFSRGDDASQRLYYYVSELQRRGAMSGPAPVIFDIARIRRRASKAWTVAAVKRLASDLGISAQDLSDGIRITNRWREAMRNLDQHRRSPGHFYERVARATMFAPYEALDLDTPPERVQCRGNALLVGSVPPDDSLHLAVESAGWNVIGEVNDRSLIRFGPPVDDDDPVECIGRHAWQMETGPRSFHDRCARVVTEVEQRDVNAVIFWLHEQDEAIAWDVVKARRALDALGKPTLVMVRRSWNLSDDPMTDIIQFLGGVQP
jgi:hypothetical protein